MAAPLIFPDDPTLSDGQHSPALDRSFQLAQDDLGNRIHQLHLPLQTEPELVAELEQIGREQGFCEEKEENEEGIRCVGAAILDLRGYPVGAVSVSSPSYRFSDEQSRSIGVFVRDTALAVSRGLGYGK